MNANKFSSSLCFILFSALFGIISITMIARADSFVYLPVVIVAPPTPTPSPTPIVPTVDPINYSGTIGPNCASITFDSTSADPITVLGAVTRIDIGTYVNNARGKSVRFRWLLNGNQVSDYSQTANSEKYRVSDTLYSSNTIPCTGELPKGDYKAEVYVEGALLRIRTLTVQ